MRVFSPSRAVFGGEHTLIQLRLGSFVAKTAYPSPIKGEEGRAFNFPLSYTI